MEIFDIVENDETGDCIFWVNDNGEKIIVTYLDYECIYKAELLADEPKTQKYKAKCLNGKTIESIDVSHVDKSRYKDIYDTYQKLINSEYYEMYLRIQDYRW